MRLPGPSRKGPGTVRGACSAMYWHCGRTAFALSDLCRGRGSATFRARNRHGDEVAGALPLAVRFAKSPELTAIRFRSRPRREQSGSHVGVQVGKGRRSPSGSVARAGGTWAYSSASMERIDALKAMIIAMHKTLHHGRGYGL
jgi:hypothetical protein